MQDVSIFIIIIVIQDEHTQTYGTTWSVLVVPGHPYNGRDGLNHPLVERQAAETRPCLRDKAVSMSAQRCLSLGHEV